MPRAVRTETPYAAQGREILTLIRKKAPESEIQPHLDTIQEQAASLGVADPLVPSTDAYVTSICHVGSKSLSHVLSCIERCKDRLLAVGPQSGAARRQIISSVMEHWRDQPGVGVNIIDKLLNYTVLTPRSVVEWVLGDRLDGGRALVLAHMYEMVSTTVYKVTNRVRQIVLARNQPDLPADQVRMLDDTLDKERGDMADLFALIDDALTAVAAGAQDQMIERAEDAGDAADEVRLLQGWADRWLRVFRRKVAVEEAYVNEAVGAGVQGQGQDQGHGDAEANGNGGAIDMDGS